MYRKTINFAFPVIFVFLLGLQAASAQQITLVKEYTSVTPIFMSGHEGDLEKIKGYSVDGDILLDGSVVGSSSGQILLLNPPVNLIERYDQAFATFTNTFPGIGSFQVTAQVVSIGSSTAPTTGDGSFAWSGTINNGSGDLENAVGLSVGIGNFNILTGTADGTETLQLRIGF